LNYFSAGWGRNRNDTPAFKIGEGKSGHGKGNEELRMQNEGQIRRIGFCFFILHFSFFIQK
jgi:hypothetical protein